MGIRSDQLGDLVGDGKFFKHVSSLMAYYLPIGHPNGLRTGTHSASTRPGSFQTFYADYFAKERETNFNGYNCELDNRIVVGTGERVLLGKLPSCSVLFDTVIKRSSENDFAYYKDAQTGLDVEFTCYSELEKVACDLGLQAFLKTVPVPENDTFTTPVKLPVNSCVGGGPFDEFPTFSMYASRIGRVRMTDDPNSWPTIKLVDSADFFGPLTTAYENDPALLPMTDGREDWLVWMILDMEIPSNSFMSLKMEVLTDNK